MARRRSPWCTCPTPPTPTQGCPVHVAEYWQQQAEYWQHRYEAAAQPTPTEERP